jgi:hypothetical protein
MTPTEHIVQFFRLVATGSVEIYNEFSLQHEFGIYLRSNAPPYFKVRFERPVGSFRLKPLPYIKKEIDIALVSREDDYKLAVELKFPRNGQYPEQMFKACQDIGFLEQLVDGGFNGGAFVIAVDDALFFSGDAKNDLYRCFRAGLPIPWRHTKADGCKRPISRDLRQSHYHVGTERNSSEVFLCQDWRRWRNLTGGSAWLGGADTPSASATPLQGP